MKEHLLHTPEGVRDIYGEEYERKLKVISLLHDKIFSYGYRDIQTPSFEFFDVFSKEIGTTPSKELYKFFDKEGNTLVLRPDFTPSIARCAAKYFLEENMPIRFSYFGNTFTNTSQLQGKLKETTQMGIELIGDSSVHADAEILSVMIESLQNTGLKDFQISVGNVEYFKGLCNELLFTENMEVTLRDYISNKNFFGAEEYLINENVDIESRKLLLKTEDLIGSVDILDDAKKVVNNDRSLNAIRHLYDLYTVLKAYGIEQYVSFDLGMLSKYKYYTGMIFKGYTYGVGDVIVKGGRYDNLLYQFGKSAPAVGFVIMIDDLMQALLRQNITLPLDKNRVIILYENTQFSKALMHAKELRQKGIPVELIEKKEDTQFSVYQDFSNRVMASDFIYMKE